MNCVSKYFYVILRCNFELWCYLYVLPEVRNNINKYSKMAWHATRLFQILWHVSTLELRTSAVGY